MKLFTGIALALGLAAFATAQDRPRILPKLRPAAQPAPVMQPAPIEGPLMDKVCERVLIRVVRNKVEAELAKDGFRLAGGMFPDAKPLSKERIAELMKQLDDETIIRSVKEASPKTWAATAEPGGFLARLIEWIATHQDEIMAVVALIIKLLALF